MKIAIVMGRGIEGCGVTKFTIELAEWLTKNGDQWVIYSAKDKSWSRKKSHPIENIIELRLGKGDEAEQMIRGCNEADVVIINSLPSKGHPQECISAFNRALDLINKPIVLIQHDHSVHSIRRNECLHHAIEKSKIIFAHSRTNDFSKLTNKEIKTFQPGMDFDSVRQKYWKPIEMTNPQYHRWIGRTTSWKGYKEMFRFHNEYLKATGAITTFEGIERSPAYLTFKTLSEFNEHINDDIENIELKSGQPVYVFGPYNNDQQLERMSRAGFGYQLSALKPHFIEKSIEYTHCEVASVGVIPVFRKSYGESCTHRYYGKKLIDCEESGTIWLDEDDMEPAFKLIELLHNNPQMRDKWRNHAFEFYKLHQGSNWVFRDLYNQIRDNING
jgi:hypothetical protein